VGKPTCCCDRRSRLHRGQRGRRYERGRALDVAVNDTLGSAGKWRNLQKRQIVDFIPPPGLFGWLASRKLDALIHLGAISSTTATDGDAVIASNLRLSLDLLDWCTTTRTPFIYASSAATYGMAPKV